MNERIIDFHDGICIDPYQGLKPEEPYDEVATPEPKGRTPMFSEAMKKIADLATISALAKMTSSSSAADTGRNMMAVDMATLFGGATHRGHRGRMRKTLETYHRRIHDARVRDTPGAERMREVVELRRSNWSHLRTS